MMKSIVFFSVFLFLVNPDAFSQKFILLQKGGNQKTRLTYEVGEELIYKTKAYDFYLSDVIVDVQKDIIVLRENVLSPSDIIAIDIRNKDLRNHTLKNLAYLGMGGGIVFLAAQGVNSLIQEGDLTQVNSWGLPLGFFAAGFILSRVEYRYFKHRGKNKIQLVILYGE